MAKINQCSHGAGLLPCPVGCNDKKKSGKTCVYKLAVGHFLHVFKNQIEGDEDMNGADTIGAVVLLYEQFKKLK